MALSFWDWSIMVAYIAFSMGVGIFFYTRASGSTSEYFMAGRRLLWWVVRAKPLPLDTWSSATGGLISVSSF